MLDTEAASIQADRFEAVRALQARYRGACVLKGAGTLVCAGEEPVGVCTAGNPGMASGGMGDVLTGAIAGVLAQLLPRSKQPMLVAARLGVCLHAAAGDCAAREGERGMLASDLMPYLRDLANP